LFAFVNTVILKSATQKSIAGFLFFSSLIFASMDIHCTKKEFYILKNIEHAAEE